MTTRTRQATGLTLTTVAATLALTACAGTSSGTTSASSPGVIAPATDANLAGDIPDDQTFVTYAPTGGGFTVDVPEGWARSPSTDGVAFTDKYNRVEITSVAATTAPSVQSVTQVDVPRLAAATTGFDTPQVVTADRNAGQAVLVTYQADSAPNRVTGKVVLDAVEQYTFWRSGTAVSLTLSAPRGSDNVDPWRTVTDSFGGRREWRPHSDTGVPVLPRR